MSPDKTKEIKEPGFTPPDLKDGREPGFAPDDLTDGRNPGHWQTRYSDPIAKKAIVIEATYLACILAFCLASLVLIILEIPQSLLNLPVSIRKYFDLCVTAWLAGTLGGTLLDIKWLCHVVGHNFWNIDRRLWRFFSPHISGVLGLLVVLIVASGLFGFFDPHAVEKTSLVIGLAFLTGYFSDSTIAKLADIATSVFGEAKEHGKKE